MENTAEQLSGYHEAHESLAYYNLPRAGYIEVGDKDRIEFIHRQTTNDMHRLVNNVALMNILTSPMARILDVMTFHQAGNALRAITLPQRSLVTSQFLQSQIFFMDQVYVTDLTQQFAQLVITGPDAKAYLDQFNVQPGPGKFVVGKIHGIEVTVFHTDEIIGPGYQIIVSTEKANALTNVLSETGVNSLSHHAYEIHRIEAGIPGAQNELTEDYTPLEMHLHQAISDSKGCYTGQEVIARQLTYDKVTRRLVGLLLPDQIRSGTVLKVDGKSSGTVTSIGYSPRFGWIGMGVVKSSHANSGDRLELEESGQNAVIKDLPFKI